MLGKLRHCAFNPLLALPMATLVAYAHMPEGLSKFVPRLCTPVVAYCHLAPGGTVKELCAECTELSTGCTSAQGAWRCGL